MSRRKTVNKTGIDRISGLGSHQAYVVYTCLECGAVNYVPVSELLEPKEAYETCSWRCEHCGFVHSKDSALPSKWENWSPELRENGTLAVQRFWLGFFTIATENREAYWKRCNMCGRILPNSAFSKHRGFGILEKQMECRACKGAINAVGNPKRTSEQMRESGARRRLGDLLFNDIENEKKIDVKDLFQRFDGKCFKTGKELDINDRSSWHIDHILPSKYFYPLTIDNAALLSAEANSNKRDRWPSDFYTPKELVKLSEITGANLDLISSPTPVYNTNIDVDGAIDKFLTVRNSTDLPKRIQELKKIIVDNNLSGLISANNKKRLGL